MKFLNILLATAITGVLASPVADETPTKLVSYQINGKSVVGEPAKNSLGKRSAQCSGNEFAFGSACTPGNCDCAGNNGCYCWSDRPYCQCMCEPSLGEHVDCA